MLRTLEVLLSFVICIAVSGLLEIVHLIVFNTGIEKKTLVRVVCDRHQLLCSLKQRSELFCIRRIYERLSEVLKETREPTEKYELQNVRRCEIHALHWIKVSWW